MTKRDASRDVAVVGMSCRFADAEDVEAFWENILERRQSFREVPKERWDHDYFRSEKFRENDKTYVDKGSFIEDFDHFAALHFGIPPRRVQVMDPQHRLMLETTREALQDAGLEKRSFDREMMGTFLGVSTSEYRKFLSARSTAMMMAGGAFGEVPDQLGRNELSDVVQNATPISAFSIPGSLLNMTAANVAHQWKLGGPAFTLDAACAASLLAVHDAVLHIRAGICETAVAGGVYMNLSPDTMVGFSRIGAISQKGACRPFDEEGDGFLQGDGCGVVILKRLDQALEEGDRIYAVIRGTGVNNDGDSPGPMAPSQDGQLDAIRRAHRDAGVDPSTIDFVACHGTATPVGDPIEVGALQRAFDPDEDDHRVWLGSVKGNVGHTMSAAGIAGFLHALLALHRRTIPPQAGFENPNPKLELDDHFGVPKEPRPWESNGHPRRAGVSAFGFGGTNVHVVLEEAPDMTTTPKTDDDQTHVVVLTGHDHALLSEHARDVARRVERGIASESSLADIALSFAGREFLDARLATVVRSKEELVDQLLDAADRLADGAPASHQLGPSTFVTPGERPDDTDGVAFMFPGQGAQRVGLMRDLYQRFPRFRARLDRLSDAVEDLLGAPISDFLYPDEEDEAAEDRLKATEVCQPVMAALGLALAGFLEDLGIEPDVVLGHSLGEFAAAAWGGILSEEDAVRFVAKRGRLMADIELDDFGAMAAVMAPADVVDGYIADYDDVVLANLNHPQQTVISGSTSGVEAVVEALETDDVKATLLRVSHAFHSPIVADIADDIAELVEGLDLSTPERTVISAITGEPYPEDVEAIRRIFVDHATSTVDFMAALQACRENGVGRFVEVGAGKTLTSFAKGVVRGEQLRSAQSLGAKEPDDAETFNRALGALVVDGSDLHPASLYEHTDARQTWLPPSPLKRRAYWTVGRRSSALDIADDSVASEERTVSDDESTSKKTADAGLVELFREQNELLRTHAEIIARQNAVLSGSGGDVDVSVDASALEGLAELSARAPGETSKRDETQTATGETEDGENIAAEETPEDAAPEIDVTAEVFDAVAIVSAFPADSLKRSQELASDLGFDSLMFVDLGRELQAKFPDVGAVPQELFHEKTTIDEIVDYLENAGGEAASDAGTDGESETSDVTKLTRYRPILRSQPLPDLPARSFAPENVLITADNGGRADAIAELLSSRGSRVALVAFGDDFDGVDGDDILNLSWPDASSLDDLFAELNDVDFSPDALIHLADFDLQKSLEAAIEDGEWPNPVVRLQRLVKALHDAANDADDAPVAFVTVTGMGSLGLDEATQDRAWQAAVSGFTKSVAREWQKTLVRTVDFDPDVSPDQLAVQLVADLSSAARDIEVAWHDGERFVVALEEDAFGGDGSVELDDESVVLITGGGRGIGAELAKSIAKRHGSNLIIVGRSELEEGTPLAENLSVMREAGSDVAYVSWDVTEPVGDRLDAARERFGAITDVVHCAGVLRDRGVAAKTVEDIETVTGVKVDGLLRLLAATADDPVDVVFGFSSWSARFGNLGQTDYAAANEVMNRLATAAAPSDPKFVSVLWPMWEESPMVRNTPEVARKAMKSQGVTFISNDVGIDAFFEELQTAGSGEFLYGDDVPAVSRRLLANVDLSLETHPYLNDHRLKGRPVMPLAAALDYVGAAARETGIDGELEITDLKLFRGVDVGQPTTVEMEVDVEDARGDVELRTVSDGETDIAYRAEFGRASNGREPAAVKPSRGSGVSGEDLPLSIEEFYDEHTFHGPSIAGVESIEEMGDHYIVGTVRGCEPSAWIDEPTRSAWAIDPMVVDSAFQLVAYWLWAKMERAGFPIGIDAVVQEEPFDPAALYTVTIVLEEGENDRYSGTFIFEDEDGEVVSTMTGVRAQLMSADDAEEEAAPDAVDIPEEHWNPEKFPELEELEQRFQMAEMLGIRNPYFHAHEGTARDVAEIGGREMLNFSSYNYLGFSGHPKVNAAASDAVEEYGTSVSASRLASGQIPLHGELEDEIAGLLGVDAALVFSAGHATNESVIGHLFGENDLIIHDSLAHNSIMTGAELSGSKRMNFPHNDWKALDRILGQIRGKFEKVGIFIEGVYSMDGDIPNLPKFIEVKKKHRGLLYVDEAHSMGVIGETGRGIGEYFDIDMSDVELWMGTLSKSFASCGGYIAGGKRLIEYLKYTVPGFIFSAGISPANAGAALASVRLLKEKPEIAQQLHDRSTFFLELCQENGIDTGMSRDSAVVPCIVGNSLECLKLSDRLHDRGINVQPIVYPAVEDDASRLRFFLSATHTEEQLRRTVEILTEELSELKSGGAAAE